MGYYLEIINFIFDLNLLSITTNNPNRIQKPLKQDKLWYVLYVKANYEKSVEDNINSLDMDIQAYSPTHFITKQWKDRKKKVLAPILPKIVLVKTEEKLREQVFNVPGTVRYLFEQKKPAIVRQIEIDQLKLITENKRIIDHQFLLAVKGDEVDLTNYGFKNIKGIIDKVSKEVCWVKLDSLGYTLKLTLRK